MRGLALGISTAALILVPLNSFSHAFKLPDTGQTKCYGSSGEIPCAGTGQDGVFNINPLSYTDNGDGTVTDNNTGLIWQQNTNSGRWADAVTYCDNLVLPPTNGYEDWRLPTKKELMSIVDYSTLGSTPTIQELYFPDAQAFRYWTSTEFAAAPTTAWVVDFAYGTGSNGIKTDFKGVRCVRGGQSHQNLTANGDGTVTDTTNALMWQQGETDIKSWYDALSFCNSLVLPLTNSYEDWRLPNIKELESLTDDTEYPAINKAFFPLAFETFFSFYWSSTTYTSSPGVAWQISYSGGADLYHSKGDGGSVRCVRSSCGNKPVSAGSPEDAYDSIQAAYNEAASPLTILAQRATLEENLTFSAGKIITLTGGFNCDFLTNLGLTTINGSLTIGGTDSLTIANIIIR
jgi:hypothetical protein